MNSICHESNFVIKSERKLKTSKNISMYNTSIFIGGHQNLKSKRIHLSTNTRYNNTAHREITNFRNKKNKSVDRVNLHTEKTEESEQNEQIDIIKMMNVRWQNSLMESRNDLNYIKTEEAKKEIKEEKKEINFDMNKYKNDLMEKISLNYNFEDIKNNQEYFVLLKLDKFNQNNIFIHEIIAPKSIQDFEKSLDKFIKRKSTQINKDNNSDSTSSIDDTKKKSKFVKQENKENINDNSQINEEEFSPIFILNQKDIKDLYFIIEPKQTNRTKSIKYVINNFSLNYIPTEEDIKLKSMKKVIIPKEENEEKEEKEEKKLILDKINIENFELISYKKPEKKLILNKINIENFELIPTEKQEKKYEISNPISVNINQEYELENINPPQTTEVTEINSEKKIITQDFSQCTPISLLQDKFSIYAVSKWIKYSLPSPQSELFIKNTYTAKNHGIFDVELLMTNFTLWIERIETKRNNEIKGSLSISSSANSNFKNNTLQKGKSLTYNKNKNTKVKINKSNNYEMGSNGSFIKPINLKTKVFK